MLNLSILACQGLLRLPLSNFIIILPVINKSLYTWMLQSGVFWAGHDFQSVVAAYLQKSIMPYSCLLYQGVKSVPTFSEGWMIDWCTFSSKALNLNNLIQKYFENNISFSFSSSASLQSCALWAAQNLKLGCRG